MTTWLGLNESLVGQKPLNLRVRVTNLQMEIPVVILLVFKTLDIQAWMNLALPGDELMSKNIVGEGKPPAQCERS